ncbi:MAG: cytochrome c oxidase subunit 3 family protein [Myxococcales bacterium]|nr:cytochrome c oxidase subunit 3 family protein [Myxococcales bacterium]
MSSHAKPSGERRFLQVHFETMGAQLAASKSGMWLFLASELLFFGGLFTAYAVYRANHPDMYHYGQYFLDWRMGAINTAVLISSSLSAAWSVRAAQLGDTKTLKATLWLTLLLAGAFLVVKYFEYAHKIEAGYIWGGEHCVDNLKVAGKLTEHQIEHCLSALPPEVAHLPIPEHMGRFFSIYFVMTGLHGLHVLIGMALYVWLLRRAGRGDFGPKYFGPVDMVALYWHIVDMIWIFLFPLLYLIG